jgi:hypothetical protein
MVDRPDWNFDNSGNAVVPADNLPAPAEVQRQIETMDGPPPTVKSTPNVPAKNVSKLADWNYDNQGNEKPRDSQGKYITASDAQLRAQWDKEGGFAQNAARVMQVEQTILGLSENAEALRSHIATLPESIQLKAADHLRLTASHGPLGGVLKFEAFCDSLSPSEWETFQGWWRKLSRGDQDAILGAISR